MRFKMKSAVAFVWSKLGYCPVCMRDAFLASFAAWLIVAGIAVFSGATAIVVFGEIPAILLTLLWCAHLLAFSIKSLTKSGEIDLSRRAAVPSFVKILIGAALASAIPSLAYATQCGGTTDCSEKTCSGTSTCSSAMRGCACQ